MSNEFPLDPKASDQHVDRAYKPSEVAELLNVTVYTVHEWLRTGQLVGIKLRSAWRVLPSDLEEFIIARRRSD